MSAKFWRTQYGVWVTQGVCSECSDPMLITERDVFMLQAGIKPVCCDCRKLEAYPTVQSLSVGRGDGRHQGKYHKPSHFREDHEYDDSGVEAED